MAISADRELKDMTIVDRRTRAWRLREQHRAELVAALGGEERLSAHQLLQLEIVLGLNALVVDFQARLAAGEQINSERFIAASKELRRVSAELKLPRTKAATLRDSASNIALQDHVAKRAAARAGATEFPPTLPTRTRPAFLPTSWSGLSSPASNIRRSAIPLGVPPTP